MESLLPALWDLARGAFGVLRWVTPIVVFGVAAYSVYLCATGFVPVLIRLGNGLRRRKIAIFAKGDAFASLEALFSDSKLFSTKNIIRVSNRDDFGRAEEASVFLVHWPDWRAEMGDIVAQKEDKTALVIYAPQGQGPLPADVMQLLELQRNVVLANLRGRLINDVVVSLITTGYEKK